MLTYRGKEEVFFLPCCLGEISGRFHPEKNPKEEEEEEEDKSQKLVVDFAVFLGN